MLQVFDKCQTVNVPTGRTTTIITIATPKKPQLFTMVTILMAEDIRNWM